MKAWLKQKLEIAVDAAIFAGVISLIFHLSDMRLVLLLQQVGGQ